MTADDMAADMTGDDATNIVPNAAMGLNPEDLLPGDVCECLPLNELSFVYEGMQMPTGYGFGGCGPHDSMVPAFGCENNELEVCSQSWCYVSPDCMGLGDVQTSLVDEMFMYSYENCPDTFVVDDGAVDDTSGTGVVDDATMMGEGDDTLMPDMTGDDVVDNMMGDAVVDGDMGDAVVDGDMGDAVVDGDMMGGDMMDGDMMGGDMMGGDAAAAGGDCDCGCACGCCSQDDIRINIEFVVNIDDDGEVAVSAA
jgi:hypothetical protein